MEISALIIGQRIRSARKAKRMTAEELAEKVGIAAESVGHIECGSRKPSLTLLFNIAQELEVSLDYLTGRTMDSLEDFQKECAEQNGLSAEEKVLLLELTKSMIPVIKRKFRNSENVSEE